MHDTWHSCPKSGSEILIFSLLKTPWLSSRSASGTQNLSLFAKTEKKLGLCAGIAKSSKNIQLRNSDNSAFGNSPRSTALISTSPFSLEPHLNFLAVKNHSALFLFLWAIAHPSYYYISVILSPTFPPRGITHVLLLFILLLRAWVLGVVLIKYQSSSSSIRITFI